MLSSRMVLFVIVAGCLLVFVLTLAFRKKAHTLTDVIERERIGQEQAKHGNLNPEVEVVTGYQR